MTKPAVGILGAGLMGAGIARCLLKAGHPVVVCVHRNRGPVTPLLEDGATEADNPVSLIQRVDTLVTCLPNADVVMTVGDDILPHLRPGQSWIDVTTSRPEVSEHLAARLRERGAIFADAPVTGGPNEAREGRLASLIGCAEEHFAKIETFVSAYSKTVRRFGDPGRGHAAKLLNNLVTQGTTVLLADAFQCAARLGVDQNALFEAMMAGAARSGTLEKAVTPALQGHFDGARFTIENAAKDLRYGRDLIESIAPHRARVVTALAERLEEHVSNGRGTDFVSTMLDPSRP